MNRSLKNVRLRSSILPILVATAVIFAAGLINNNLSLAFIRDSQTDSQKTSQESKTPALELKIAAPVERELKAGEGHNYVVTLTSGQYLHVIVEQKGIDVVVRLFGPDGQKLTEVDSPNGKEGPEPLSMIAEVAGEYRLEVRSLEEKAETGRYEVNMRELRAATRKDTRAHNRSGNPSRGCASIAATARTPTRLGHSRAGSGAARPARASGRPSARR